MNKGGGTTKVIEVGDYVLRKSYNKDILFRVQDVSKQECIPLIGISYRIVADAPLQDLELAGGMRFTNQEHNVMEQVEENVALILAERAKEKVLSPGLQKTGKVLHVDGDAFYLNLCMRYYEMLGVNAVGENVLEFQQPRRIKDLIERYNPDILVLTGHDALNKNYTDLHQLKEYKNSHNFVEAVKQARSIRPTSSQLVIFAGACQSNFEAILEAGADYASSPQRELIHALDPLFLVERIAYCSFHKVLQIEEALKYTLTKFRGLGGYETIGKARKGGPAPEVDLSPTVAETGVKREDEKRDKKEDSTSLEMAIDKLTDEEIERELAKPLFKEDLVEYVRKMKEDGEDLVKCVTELTPDSQ
jgi:spore coat assembly protein